VLAAKKALADAEAGGDEDEIAEAQTALDEAEEACEATSEGKASGGACDVTLPPPRARPDVPPSTLT
jgi:hypothetical protein